MGSLLPGGAGDEQKVCLVVDRHVVGLVNDYKRSSERNRRALLLDARVQWPLAQHIQISAYVKDVMFGARTPKILLGDVLNDVVEWKQVAIVSADFRHICDVRS